MHSYAGLAPVANPWTPTTHQDWDEACRRCEIRVSLSADQHRAIRNSMRYDRRPQGNRGRCLSAPFPALGLQVGDRLEEVVGAFDISAFDEAGVFPLRCVFWRRSAETAARHRTPLFDPLLGISVAIVVVDTLHCLGLGVLQHFTAHALHSIIAAN
eukprot:3286074-Alexandrium_andersonii.AAC.1